MTTCLAPTRGLLRASRRYETVAVGHHTTPVDTDTPMAVTPDRTFDDVETPFAVFVPGGGAATLDAATDERLVEYARSAAHHAENVGATSTGAFVLAEAGLLDRHRVMTHAAYGDRLRGLGYEVGLQGAARQPRSLPRGLTGLGRCCDH